MKIFFCAHKVLLALFYLFTFSVASTVFAANIQVKVDRNPVSSEESFQLIFTTNESPDDDPDFAPLHKDFEILNQSEQHSTQINNWKQTKHIQWILTVMAKRTGNLVIPVIHFGKDNSLVAAVVVTEALQADNAGINEELFLQVSVNTEMPYIQEQVIYTLKLFSKVKISQAALTEPVLNDAVIIRLGEDKNYSTQYNGENYVVIERKYAIFPQKSGYMSIAPLTLTASIALARQARYSRFYSQQRTRNKRIVSNSIGLNVQAKPANNTHSTWLPAEQVYIEEKWSVDPQEITLGEPVTRTISLLAKGITVSALPQLQKKKLPKQIKSYPDQPILREAPQGKTVVAIREEKVALIASEVGTYTLPAIEIPWWDTRTQTQEMAVIPEKQLIVVAGGLNHTYLSKPEVSIPKLAAKPVALMITKSNNLWFVLALFFGSAWILTLLYLVLKRRSKNAVKKSQKIAKKSIAFIKQLKQACAENDGKKAKQVLLNWGREQFQKNSLEAIAEECDSKLKAEIQSLNTTLYGKESLSWQGSALLQAFQENEKKAISSKKIEDGLPPLFKI
jgi:hypothetical protein